MRAWMGGANRAQGGERADAVADASDAVDDDVPCVARSPAGEQREAHELDGELLTPGTSAGLLPGTLRAAELEIGTISEATLTVAELRRARRVWLINSVRGWVEVDVDLATVPSYLATVEAGQPTLDG